MSLQKQFSDPVTERMRPADWRDRYRWPDPEGGWSGPLAGYMPDDPARAGRACPPGVVFPGDVAETPPAVTKPVTKTPVAETPAAAVAETPGRVGRPKSDSALSAAERMRLSRARKKEQP
jgi:hypothetical protein